MVTLRNGSVNRGAVVDVIPFEDSNLIKVIGEHPRGHQSR
jgi:hypothetical protein